MKIALIAIIALAVSSCCYSVILNSSFSQIQVPSLDELFVTGTFFGSVIAAMSPISFGGSDIGTYFVALEEPFMKAGNLSVVSTLVLPSSCRSSSLAVNYSHFISFCNLYDDNRNFLNAAHIYSVEVSPDSSLMALKKASKLPMASVVLGFDGNRSIYFLGNKKNQTLGMKLYVLDTQTLTFERVSKVGELDPHAEFSDGVIVGNGRYIVCTYQIKFFGSGYGILRIDLETGSNVTIPIDYPSSFSKFARYNDTLGYILNSTRKTKKSDIVQLLVLDLISWKILDTIDLPSWVGGYAGNVAISQTSLFVSISYAAFFKDSLIIQIPVPNGVPDPTRVSAVVASGYHLTATATPTAIYTVDFHTEGYTYYYVQRYWYTIEY